VHDHNSSGGRIGPIEWAAAGRPLPTEYVSGDQPIAVAVDEHAALFGVVDGLGHGPAAQAAAVRAVEVLEESRAERVETLVQLCHRALGGTRGVAMTLARVDYGAGALTWAGVGNVRANLVTKDASGPHVRSSALLAAGIVGDRIRETAPAQSVSIRAGDLIVMSSDGIGEDYLRHIDFAAPAAVIAQAILRKNARETDDALVLTARHRGAST
jgi:phosphoserine phosphatase RsbX